MLGERKIVWRVLNKWRRSDERPENAINILRKVPLNEPIFELRMMQMQIYTKSRVMSLSRTSVMNVTQENIHRRVKK